MNRKNLNALTSGYWGRTLLLSVMLFFLYLGDGILSDWVPAFMQTSTNSAVMMGLLMAFSSIVGFGADLVFPQILKVVKTRKLMLMAIGTSLVFSGVLLWTIAWPWIVLFLISMAIWGLYYEFLGFGVHQFVATSIPNTSRSGVWAIMSVFKSLAYFLGPIIGSYVAITMGDSRVILSAVACILVGYLFWLLLGKNKEKNLQESYSEKIRLVDEIKHWITLSEHVWQVLLISLMMGLIDATFWTTGTILTDNMAKENWLGGMFLPLYMLPMVFVGLIVARWGVYKGKKKLAEIFMLISGVVLALLGVNGSLYFALTVSFLVGIVLSVAWPLTDAVYSDIISRMGKEGKHMMGLSSSTISVAYIIGPVLAGSLTQMVGDKMAFSIIGMMVAVVALFLLFVTPKKLRLPQAEIKTWD